MAVDIRYMVASQRYEITQEIRGVLKGHFEDYFQSLDHVNSAAKRLRKVAERANSTTQTLFKSSASSVSNHSNIASPANGRAENPGTMPRAFDRVWKLEPEVNDQEVVEFSAWSALLLHLMVHKAYCVLYRPLFRDPSMGAHESIRSKYGLYPVCCCGLY